MIRTITKPVNKPLNVELPVDLIDKLKVKAVNNNLPLKSVVTLALRGGLSIVTEKLGEIEPALTA